MVRHQLKSVVDMDPAKEGVKCTRETDDTRFDGVHSAAGANRIFGDHVQCLHALFKRGDSGFLICHIRKL